MESERPILITSLDYELFFARSGTPERCLFEPCDALLELARSLGLTLTFFVDAGMLIAMDRQAAENRILARHAEQVRRHIEALAGAGHEIALHVHPHWQDTRWEGGSWQFSGTRYQLSDFSESEISGIVAAYTGCLTDLAGRSIDAYRAGGFCAEPFPPLGKALSEVGIKIDSSVVPGASLADADKGFDFRRAPRDDWWSFNESPSVPETGGRFLEVPITPQRLPLNYYWQRLYQRLAARQSTGYFGDGMSKAIGRREIIRRLAGLSRTAELSVDHPKVAALDGIEASGERRVWHLMGHPKLLSKNSLRVFAEFVERMTFLRSETVSSLGRKIMAGRIRPAEAPTATALPEREI